MSAIVLIGPMGAGKTSVGRKLAKRLGTGFTDTDAAVARAHGPIDKIFRSEGEARFREWEAAAVATALSDGGVVSLGGGAVLHQATRAMLHDHRVVLLTVSPEVVAGRIGGTVRPLLVGEEDPLIRWRRIADERDPLYRELADLVIDTSRGPLEGVVDTLEEWAAQRRSIRPDGRTLVTETTITVAGDPGYDITVGRGILDRLGAALPPAARKVLVVHPPTLAAQAEALREQLGSDPASPRDVLLAEIPDAEQGKRIEVAAFCWQVMGKADFTRTDAVIGFGGGAVTDLAGFVAATWLRGVAVVQVPTTVLAMVDAAVGGKTGVNTAEGKNLVGAFWPPTAVLCDLDLLDTLSEHERVAGFAEVVKAGFIWYPEILDLIEADPKAVVDPATPAFRRAIELAIEMKARVVGEDLREASLREVLNYGHTLGHAIEHAERYRWRHGAAISVGMVFAAELSRLAGRLSDEVAQRHRTILELLGLPTSYRAGAWPQLLATMQRDKKSRGGMLRFIVLDDLARPTVLQAPDESLLFAAYQEVGA